MMLCATNIYIGCVISAITFQTRYTMFSGIAAGVQLSLFSVFGVLLAKGFQSVLTVFGMIPAATFIPFLAVFAMKLAVALGPARFTQ
jgi:hypothetical protein